MPALKTSKSQADHSSTRERASIQAERDAKALFAAAFLRDRIGDRFEGTVSGLSSSGVFVSLDTPPVDGMVRRALIEREHRDSYELDELGARLIGARTGNEIKLGDRVIVEVIDASLQRRQIDLALMGQLSA